MPIIETSAHLRCVPFAKAHPYNTALTSVVFVLCIIPTVERGGLPLFEIEHYEIGELLLRPPGYPRAELVDWSPPLRSLSPPSSTWFPLSFRRIGS